MAHISNSQGVPSLANGEVQSGAGCWKELVLTLDGGGVRGYSSLLILEALMAKCAELERAEDGKWNSTGQSQPNQGLDRSLSVASGAVDMRSPLPCHYFDYVIGTSTGGLIAIMLGRLRMRVEDCVTEYERLGKEVFGKPRPLKYYKYSHTNLERVIKDVVQRHCRDGHSAGNGRDLLEQPESHINRCRTAVVTVRRNKPGNDKVHLFRSYIHTRTVFERNPAARARERNPDDPDSVYIWEAGRATSAAPHYFHEITIHGNDYMDGGVEENNPSAEAWYEASQMHSQRSGPRDLHGPGIGVFVSVGTGLSAPVSFFSKGNSIRKVAAIFKKARKSLTDPERTEKQVRVMASNTDVPYYRLNVTTGLENMKMDQWQTLKSRGEEHNITLASIQKETKKYLELDGTKREIFRCATKLVDYRRKRCPNDEARRFSGLTTPGPGQRSLQHQAPTHHSLGVPHATMTPEADSGQQSQHLSPQQQRSHTTNSHQSRQWQRSYIQEQQEAAQEMPSRDGHPPHGFPYFEYQRGPPQHTSDEYNSSSTYYPASSPVEMPQPLTIHEV